MVDVPEVRAADARLFRVSSEGVQGPGEAMTARELLAKVADALRARGHGATLEGRELWCADRLLAWETRDGQVTITGALVFNGHYHVVPDDCDTSTVTPGSRYATVDRVVQAIEKRMAARAKSLPVPVDASAIVRDTYRIR